MLGFFAPEAKRIIWLTQGGAPSQLELFDPKPGLKAMFSKDLPDSIRGGQRLTGMTTKQADDLCLIRTMNTEAINHDPAMTLLQTGSQVSGRPSFGAWISYGLGSVNENLPAFTMLISRLGGGTNGHCLPYSKKTS